MVSSGGDGILVKFVVRFRATAAIDLVPFPVLAGVPCAHVLVLHRSLLLNSLSSYCGNAVRSFAAR